MVDENTLPSSLPDSPGGMREGITWLVFPPMPTVADSIFPPVYPPLGILSLGTAISSEHPVKLMDTACEGFRYSRFKANERLAMIGYPPEKTAARILETRPAAVGFSCLLSSQMDDIIATCRLIKQHDKNIVTITGGGHPSFLAERYLMDPAIDFIVHGEGETALLKLLAALRGEGEMRNVPGISWRYNGDIQRNSSVLIKDLDSLGLPRRELLPIERYFKLRSTVFPIVARKRSTNIMTSRGCPFKCRFCSSTIHWEHSFRVHSQDHVMAELWDLKKRYRVEEVQFFDDHFFINRKRAEVIIERMLEENIDLKWSMPIGVGINFLDRDLLRLMRKSGCRQISVAIESGSQEELDKQNKPVDLSGVAETIQAARNEGLLVFGFFIVGFPGETRQQFEQTVSLAQTLPLHLPILFGATPLVGTELAQDFIDAGAIGKDYEFDEMDYFNPQFDVSEVSPTEIHDAIVAITRQSLFAPWFRRRLPAFALLYFRNTLLWPSFFTLHLRRHFRRQMRFFRLLMKRALHTAATMWNGTKGL